MAHKFPSVSDMTGFLKPAPAWDSDNIPEAQDTACQVPAWTGLLLVVSPPAAAALRFQFSLPVYSDD